MSWGPFSEHCELRYHIAFLISQLCILEMVWTVTGTVSNTLLHFFQLVWWNISNWYDLESCSKLVLLLPYLHSCISCRVLPLSLAEPVLLLRPGTGPIRGAKLAKSNPPFGLNLGWLSSLIYLTAQLTEITLSRHGTVLLKQAWDCSNLHWPKGGNESLLFLRVPMIGTRNLSCLSALQAALRAGPFL